MNGGSRCPESGSAGPAEMLGECVVSRRGALSVVAVGLGGIGMPVASAPGAAAVPRVSYDAVVLADRPVAFWAMSSPHRGAEKDLSGHRHTGRYVGGPSRTKLPNGETAAVFRGTTRYLEAPDAAALSPATTGMLTLEAWMRPDTLQFPHAEGSGYVHWMGKGTSGNHEYVARMYSARNEEDRPNRISGYAFNLAGGQGAGSYFEEKIQRGQWIHYVLVINARKKADPYPNGYTKIYRDGVLKDQTDLSYRGTVIRPTRGNAPFRVGTRDLRSFFDGAIGKVAVYDKELSEARIKEHFRAMIRR